LGVDACHELAQQRRVGRRERDEQLAAIGVDRDQPLYEASNGLAAPDHPERGVAVVSPIELAARALPAQKPRETELAQLSPNLLGRRPDPDAAKLLFGRRRLSRRGLRGVTVRSTRGEQRKSGNDGEARHERGEAQPAEGHRAQRERAEDQLNLTGSWML